MGVAFIVLGLGLLVSGVVMLFASWGMKWEISQAAPAYADRLYNPVADQFLLGHWPLRGLVLFREPVPPQVASTVRLLQIIYAVHSLLFAAFLACVLAAIVWYWK